MDIEIKDVNGAIANCDTIKQYASQLSAQVDELQSVINEVNSKWESSGMDKESYMQELQKQANNLTQMESIINNFVITISNYAKNIQDASSKTVQ